MRYTPYLLSAGLMLAALNSQAAPYLLLEAGQVRSDLDTAHFQAYNSQIINGGGNATLSDENSNTALLLGLGYQYSAHLAVEIGYLDLGEFSATSNTTDTNSSGVTRTRSIQETSEQRGLLFSAVGQYPVNDQWQLKGHLGLVWLDQTASGSARGQSVNAAGTVIATEREGSSKSNKEWAPVIGLGTGYQLNPDWQLQLNWRRIIGTEPGVLGEQDLDLLTAGLSIRF